MSVQTALRFIQQARHDKALRRELAAPGDAVTLEQIIQIAAAAGFSFTAEELQQAHKHDWAMRWARYGDGKTMDGGEATR